MAAGDSLRILLTGASGQIGWELARALAPLGRVVAPDSAQLDLCRPETIRRWLEEVRPQLVVNAAAYTAVDKAEEEPDAAMAINGHAPGIMGEAARRTGAVVIHYSTDYVFDGTKNSPYRESDPVNPINVYGRTKLAGEQALAASGAQYIVFRTSWIYGLRGKNFLLSIRKLASERKNLAVVDDQIGAPTWCRLTAEATAQAIAKFGTGLGEVPGVYNLSCQDQTSWYGFAKAILELYPDLNTAVDLRPIPSSEYATAARRPGYSVLDGQKLWDIFGLELPAWRHALKLAVTI